MAMERPRERCYAVSNDRFVCETEFTGMPNRDYRERVYRLVRKIPSGRVMTYGQLAEILGDGYTPRTVGFVMHGSDDRTPWHRVVNAQGGCSTGRIVVPHDKQQRMLEHEGVKFNEGARCELKEYLWIPSDVRTAAKQTSHKKRATKKK
jgi:methylated-DNA-protein-cysteine methyltransferase-like protein